MMGKRLAFTGGSGVVGRTVVPYLVERGHKVLNLDLKPLDAPGVRTIVADLADNLQRPLNAFWLRGSKNWRRSGLWTLSFISRRFPVS